MSADPHMSCPRQATLNTQLSGIQNFKMISVIFFVDDLNQLQTNVLELCFILAVDVSKRYELPLLTWERNTNDWL